MSELQVDTPKPSNCDGESDQTADTTEDEEMANIISQLQKEFLEAQSLQDEQVSDLPLIESGY
jgi:hypothetical protein